MESILNSIRDDGGSCSGELLDVTNADRVDELIDRIEAELGEINVLIYNVGAQTGLKSLAETSIDEFERAWQSGSKGLFV